jgi:hypothetical protein
MISGAPGFKWATWWTCSKTNLDVPPFYAACQRGHLEIATLLAESGDCRVDLEHADDEGRSPFYAACESKRLLIINTLRGNTRRNREAR